MHGVTCTSCSDRAARPCAFMASSSTIATSTIDAASRGATRSSRRAWSSVKPFGAEL
jgi:hypothetical protein